MGEAIVYVIGTVVVTAMSHFIARRVEKRQEKQKYLECKRNEITRFIQYAAEMVFVKEYLSHHSMELWKRYGVLSYYCTYEQMRAVEDFIITFGRTSGIFPAERKQAYREMCTALSACESRHLKRKHKRAIRKNFEEERARQDALEKTFIYESEAPQGKEDTALH